MVVCSLAILLFWDTVMHHEVFFTASREQPQATFSTSVLHQTISDLMQLQSAVGAYCAIFNDMVSSKCDLPRYERASR